MRVPARERSASSSVRIEIACGFLTLPVWAFAWLFYRHRQRRWKKLLRHPAM
jgi:hypothetical protein